MRIDLEYPFNKDWRLGYLREDKKDGRKRVDLFNSNQERTTISYSRYLMSVNVGRYLTDDEEVDHIDSDKTNDDISNLQILSIENHKLKTIKERSPRKTEVITCAFCGKIFERFSNRLTVKRNNRFCSRRCNGKFYWSEGFNNK